MSTHTYAQRIHVYFIGFRVIHKCHGRKKNGEMARDRDDEDEIAKLSCAEIEFPLSVFYYHPHRLFYCTVSYMYVLNQQLYQVLQHF